MPQAPSSIFYENTIQISIINFIDKNPPQSLYVNSELYSVIFIIFSLIIHDVYCLISIEQYYKFYIIRPL